ncbi:Fe-S cluster assembly protein SufD [Agarilytica rhodophyticola]|uniref:Fe-S cluster assembly protein SufD n=1 Tax=Agarilytica rhodophyticola TaxID=1737490 RepID=UPI000B3429F5|nr:Fe-S cluster assembly protein SufD [Agarilytica rhodophyticola]
MTSFVDQALAYPTQDSPAWLQGFKQEKTELWQQASFPHRKTEHWKYTNLKALEQGEFFQSPASTHTLDEKALERLAIPGLDTIDLIFINGVFQQHLSTAANDLPEGLNVTRFAEASSQQQDVIQEYLGNVAKDLGHLFVTLNNSHLADGVFVSVDKNTQASKPIRIVQLTSAQAQNFAVAPRLLVVLEEGAEACVIEHFASDDNKQTSFVNAVCEIEVKDNAKLEHYRLHLEHESNLHIGGMHVNLRRDAVLDSFHLALGSVLKRIDVVVNHLGKGAHSNLNGVYLPSNKQHVDYHTCIEHAVPHCTSNEVFRGIISDNAKAVFNGRIHIHKDAQKTLAQLSNKNLLTSNKAEIDTKPELEIYADDVQCAHGATVAQLDDNAMHYLMTRGVSKDDARVMMSFGFINELINQINHEALANYLRPKMAQLFSGKIALLDQAL